MAVQLRRRVPSSPKQAGLPPGPAPQQHLPGAWGKVAARPPELRGDFWWPSNGLCPTKPFSKSKSGAG